MYHFLFYFLFDIQLLLKPKHILFAHILFLTFFLYIWGIGASDFYCTAFSMASGEVLWEMPIARTVSVRLNTSPPSMLA